MDKNQKKSNQVPDRQRAIPTVSSVFEDGSILEMTLQPHEKRSSFALCKNGSIEQVSFLDQGPLTKLVPYSPNNNLIRNEVVLFPEKAEEYGSEEYLIQEIQEYIHRYVDVSPLFEKISAYYVLLSWVYHRFNELPYLRLRGEPGCGKTRFLLTVGSICYKPIFASGASTVSPIFRILDIFRGTLIIDEGDFRSSDDKADVIKILNNGNGRGIPVLRSEVTGNGKEYNPKAYHVFGPKIVSTHGFFQDRALESRCLTEILGRVRLRADIPISLPEEYRAEAQTLRNKLLMFRFRNLHRPKLEEQLVDPGIEPRLKQIFAPLLSIITDEQAREELKDLSRLYHREMINERGNRIEAEILEVIRDILSVPFETPLMVKDITSWLIDRHGSEHAKPITPHSVGWAIRRRLNLKTYRTRNGYMVEKPEKELLARLCEQYGLSADADSEAVNYAGTEACTPGELPPQ